MRSLALGLGIVIAVGAIGCLAPDAVPGGAGGAGSDPRALDVVWHRAIGDETGSIFARGLVTIPGSSAVLGADFDGQVALSAQETYYADGGDALLAELKSDGSIGWSASLTGPGTQSIFDVASGGNTVFAGGLFENSLTVGGDTTDADADASPDGFLAAFDLNGALLRVTHVGGAGNQEVHAVAALPDGGVIFGGTFGQGIEIDGMDQEISPEDGLDFFIAKLDASGAPAWVRSLGGDPDMLGGSPSMRLAVTLSGDVRVSGSFTGTLVLPGNPGAIGDADLFIAGLGSDGEPAWATSVGAQGHRQRARGIAVTGTNDIWVTSDLRGTVTFEGGQKISGPDSDDPDLLLMLLGADGSLVWARSFGGPSEQTPRAIAASASMAAIGGCFRAALDLTASGGFVAGGAKSERDAFAATFSPSGVFERGGTWGLDQDACVTSLALTPEDDLIVAGDFEGDIDLGGETLSAETGHDVFVMKLRR